MKLDRKSRQSLMVAGDGIYVDLTFDGEILRAHCEGVIEQSFVVDTPEEMFDALEVINAEVMAADDRRAGWHLRMRELPGWIQTDWLEYEHVGRYGPYGVKLTINPDGFSAMYYEDTEEPVPLKITNKRDPVLMKETRE